MEVKEFRLYKGCKKRNSKIQHEVFNTYLKRFLSIAGRYTQQNEDARDIVQESFVKIFDKIESFEWKGEKSFENWMRRVVTNNAIAYYQKQKKQNTVFLDEETDIEDQIEDNFDVNEHSELKPGHFNDETISDEMLLSCLQELPDNFRIVFNMFVIDEFSHKEIAEKLGIPEKTSTTRLFRARKILQKELYKKIKQKHYANAR